MEPTRVCMVLAGTTGAGHFTRAVAVARALERLGTGVRLTLIAPPNPWPALSLPSSLHHVCLTFRPEEYTTPGRALASALGRALATHEPDVILCDLHWVPVQQVLAAGFPAEGWLLLRSHVPRWLEGPSFASFRPDLWHRVLAIEPISLSPPHERIDPVVVADPEECMPGEALHDRLGLPRDMDLTVAMQAGKEGEVGALAGEVIGHLHRSDLRGPDALFPMGCWLRGTTRVLSGAGYNAFWESKWLGHHARTHFTPFVRPIDDQAWRLRACRDVVMRENGANQLARMLGGG